MAKDKKAELVPTVCTDNYQTAAWKSNFGDEYAERNKITQEDLKNRKNLWRAIIAGIVDVTAQLPESFIEVGAGVGINIQAISDVLKNMRPKVIPKFTAIEINDTSITELRKLNDYIDVLVIPKNIADNVEIAVKADVVFTSGLLIHIHPNKLLEAMKKIVDMSNKYVVCIEYFSPEQREIKYRGENSLLWTNDFGSIYLDEFGLSLIYCLFLWDRLTGMDNTTLWVFEKK